MEAPDKSMWASMVERTSRHAAVALAAIVVLAIVSLGLYVYYHGTWLLGPYSKAAVVSGGRTPPPKSKMIPKRPPAPPPPADVDDASVDDILDAVDG